MVYLMLFWMGSMYKSALLMMGLHKALCFGFTVFLLYINALPEGVSIILLTALTLNVFRFLIFDNNLNSFLKLSLVIVTLWTGARSCFSISTQEKLYLFDPNIQITLVWICLSLIKKSPFQLLGLSFYVILDWSSYTVLTGKTPSKKIGALVFPMKFLSSEVMLYLYKSTIQPCM